MKRGEVWTLAGGGDYVTKPRPAVILQDDSFDSTDSVTICALTSDLTPAPRFRLTIEPNHLNGLRSRSNAMVDKITTVPRTRLGRQIGVLELEHLRQIGRLAVVFLGLAAGEQSSAND